MSAKRKAASGTSAAAAEDGGAPAAKKRKVPVRGSYFVIRLSRIACGGVVGVVEGLEKFLSQRYPFCISLGRHGLRELWHL